MKSKKASSFYILIVTIIVVLILFFTIFKLLDKYEEISKSKTIGQRQNELFHLYQRAEKALLYIDQSAKQATEQAIYDFSKNGGLKERKCGSYKGYAVWDFSNGNNCFAEMDTLPYYINENLNSYLSAYPDKEIHIPTDNYNYYTTYDKEKVMVVGIADDSIRIEVGR